MVNASLLAALMSICAWLSIPLPPIAVTMQTFGVFLTLGLLGGKWGTASVAIYLLLGSAGLPVFAGFRGGAGVLFGASGGFILGFLGAALCYWALQKTGKLPAMLCGMGVCYLCGCLWYSLWAGNAGFFTALGTCVVPYLIPDGIKIGLAWSVSRRLAKYLQS